MVRFAHPQILYGLALIPVWILFWAWVFHYKQRLMKRLGDLELIQQLSAMVSRKKQVLKVSLLLLAFIFLVVGLADPQIGTRLEEVKRKGVDIFIALDVSKSMLAEDVAPNRLEKAKHEIAHFIDQLRGDRIGLIPFAGIAFVHCPLTLDYGAAKLFLNEIDTDIIPTPGTAIAEAIKTAQRSFVARELKHKVLILITDGEDHEGKPVEAAKEAARQGIVIYTIGIGTPGGAPIPVYDAYGNRIGYKKDRQGNVITTKLDVVTLEKIAFETGGKFYISSSGESELDKIYQEISKMEKKELGTRKFTHFEDRFQIFLFLAFVALTLETVMSERRTIREFKNWYQKGKKL